MPRPTSLVLNSMPAAVDPEQCLGAKCRACLEVCPTGAIDFKGTAHVRSRACVDCRLCLMECPAHAITMSDAATSNTATSDAATMR